MPTGNEYSDVRFNKSNDANNPQFSQDREGDPIKLMEQTRASIQAHADLNEAYGLCQPVQDLGTHCWLRDSLAEPSEREPGNAEPQQDVKTPFGR